ncbi:HAD family hydrolase [Brachybacterium saurashtrense]|uniref:Haloacid dehalogenase-like hydrolase n=1 Tax=Brachybacterium saurashtrense TaxID=556288 RepID=A0A345YLW3_9MICO|nr:HAD family hydrolase [Brachybacterium saurashtrense]AXK44915.1 haloacid dehalogenase-like hydrolase [Brachybacterium saurashtrense]RRR21599.1 haloacid dehalogenase-like hydrolase [Brachybacterium saurashtrense]
MTTQRLPSWRPGPTRNAILSFLDGIADVPVKERVAYLDNDGTMWCEKPTCVQYDFFLDALEQRAVQDPSLATRPEFAAVLSADMQAIGEMGLAEVAVALAALFDGATPEEFGAAVDDFVERYRHPTQDVPITSVVYQPMLELIEELRARDVTVGLVTAGGTEFVRRISQRLYGIPPELVVGTIIGYEFSRTHVDRPRLRRTVQRMGTANEGPAKIANIQAQTGRRPLIAVGNSGGDREMLEWAKSSPRGGLAILIDHDDADHEYDYRGSAATFQDAEPITTVAERLGWVTVSIAEDWTHVFPTVERE